VQGPFGPSNSPPTRGSRAPSLVVQPPTSQLTMLGLGAAGMGDTAGGAPVTSAGGRKTGLATGETRIGAWRERLA
jgi:hypothetical protein